jgi:hypothetical protein
MSPRPPRTLSPDARAAIQRLRRHVAPFDDVTETLTFGNPTFQTHGKTFAVLDRYQGADCLWLRVDSMERPTLLKMPGWFAAPYDPRQSALCIRLDAIDWRRISSHIRISRLLAQHSVAKRKR